MTGTGEFGLRSLSALAGVATVPVAYLIGVELRGRRAGLMAAALVAVNPMLLWYSQEARGLLAARPALRGLAALLRARPAQRPPPRLRRSGGSPPASPSRPTTSPSSRSPPRRSGCCAAAAARALAGLGIVALFGLALAPLAIHQMSIGHAEWIGNFTLGHRLWETAATFVTGETSDIIARPERPGLVGAALPSGPLLDWVVWRRQPKSGS